MGRAMPRLIIMRHGATEWSKSGQYTSRTDLDLLPEGIVEARDFSEVLVGLAPDAVIRVPEIGHILRSPRKRCEKTLELVLGDETQRRRMGLPEVQIVDDCREWDYGDWQLYRDGTQDHPTDPNLPGESPQHISDRADRVVAMVRGLHSSTHQDVLLFTHGHFSKVLAARFVRLPVSYAGMFQVDTSGVIVLSYAHGTMDEPTLAGMFSPSLHPKPRSPIGAPSGRHEEYQYLELIDAVIRKGEVRADRTGTGTLACFAPQHTLSFDLSDGTLPLLTTKRVFFRGVLQELLWFIGGRTDAKWLTERDIHIWDGNGSREFLEQRGLGHRREGDLGPVYGFQWRHFGAKYVDADTDYTGQGVDQLASVIRQIRENPTDRRILMSAWNPADLQDMALPPCHILCQFFVSLPDEEARAKGQRPRLSCQMYQRSCDLGLGVPFNIASYALLTHIIAAVTDCDAASFSLVMGDAHVYRDHVTPLQAQLQRQPRPFPKVQFKRAFSSIDDVQYEDVELLNYHPHGKVEMKMSV